MTFRKFTLAMGLATCMALAAGAEDKVRLNNGTEWVGEIIEQTEHYIIIRVKHGSYVKDMTFFKGDVAEIIEDAATETAEAESTEAAAATTTTTATEPEAGSGTVILRLPLVGGVGETMRHQEIEKVAAYADKLKKEKGISPIIVLEIESPGGAMSEMYAIHDTLMEVKKRHRVVAWIKEAISAAAATAFHCDEIYFRTDGSLGAMTGYNPGSGEALKGAELQRWLTDASAWAEAGGRPGLIAKAMIHHPFEVSYDVDEETGEVTWYDTLEGEYDLSDATTNLTFTSGHAEQSGFADGIADSEQKLAELLDMKEWNEDPYAKKLQEEWMKTFEKANYEIPMIFGELQIIQGGSLDAEGKLRAAIAKIDELIKWWKKEPDLCRAMGLPSQQDLERLLREYQKALSDMKNRG